MRFREVVPIPGTPRWQGGTSTSSIPTHPSSWSDGNKSGPRNSRTTRARELLGEQEIQWLHPLLMHRLFAPRWHWGLPASIVASYTEHRLLPEEQHPGSLDLPESYAAVRAYFSPCFPNTPENRAGLERVISTLAEQTPVVLVGAREEAPGYEPFEPDPGLPVHDVSDQLEPRTNLALQSRIVGKARVFVCTYGGFSYLGPFVGTQTLAVYSRAQFEIAHLDAIDRIGRRLDEEGTRLFRARHIDSLHVAAPLE